MRTCALYIDQGDGWHNHTGREQDTAALVGLTIEWGADSITSDPDTNVLSFRLRDRTGEFAGRVSQLLGSRVWVQITRTPSWADLMAVAIPTQTWSDTDGDWASLHEDYWADPYAPPDERGITLFQGVLTTGGTVTKNGDEWLLDLYATSITVRLDRDTATGPITAERQWAGNPTDMLAAVRDRLTADGVWDMSDATADRIAGLIPDALGGWESDEQVSTRQALDQLTNWHPHVIRWYERHDADGDEMDAWSLGAPSRLILHGDGAMSVESDGRRQDVLPASAIMVDAATFDVPEPYSSLHIDGLNGDQQDTVVIDATQLPDGLIQAGQTLTLQSTIRLDRWQPDDGLQADARAMIEAQDTRLTPSGMGIDQKRVSLDDYPSLFTPGPALWGILQSAYASLYTSQGIPAIAGPWVSVGGTVSFQWREGRPTFTHMFNLSPLPLEWDAAATWSGVTIPLAWQALNMAWAEFALLTFETND